MKRLPEKFLARMKGQLGLEFPDFLACYDRAPVRGLRVNGLKTSPEFLRARGFELLPSGMLEEGFILQGDVPNIGNHPYHLAGLFYMQEPSAMSAVAACKIRPGMRVLDLCAAPGGKSGGIAARLAGKGFLLSNEPIPARAKVLGFNLQRLGAINCAVSAAYPEAVAQALPEYFDVTLVDAPCSGEGMFRKDDAAIAEWSPEHVAACAKRQAAILESAWRCVGPGGALVYSTCTFSPEENEGVVEGFLRAHPEFSLEAMQRLYPHTSSGEGHFVARLVKPGEPSKSRPGKRPAFQRPGPAWEDFQKENFDPVPGGEPVLLPDGRVLLLPELPPEALKLRLLFAGIEAGELKKGRFQPGHPLYLACHGGGCRNTLDLSLKDPRLAAYLRGETIPGTLSGGWCAVCVDGHALGFGKAVEGTIKNHLPKGLRLHA